MDFQDEGSPNGDFFARIMSLDLDSKSSVQEPYAR